VAAASRATFAALTRTAMPIQGSPLPHALRRLSARPAATSPAAGLARFLHDARPLLRQRTFFRRKPECRDRPICDGSRQRWRRCGSRCAGHGREAISSRFGPSLGSGGTNSGTRRSWLGCSIRGALTGTENRACKSSCSKRGPRRPPGHCSTAAWRMLASAPRSAPCGVTRQGRHRGRRTRFCAVRRGQGRRRRRRVPAPTLLRGGPREGPRHCASPTRWWPT
jgi:hypothetical protein